MFRDGITLKLLVLGLVGLACFAASMFVFDLVGERENRYSEAKNEISSTWGGSQTVIGPILVFTVPRETPNGLTDTIYVLPHSLKVESVLAPEIRTRGIFETIVYDQTLKIYGAFATADIVQGLGRRGNAYQPFLAVSLSDARSIKEQIFLHWNDNETPFEPGTNIHTLGTAGIHASVPLDRTRKEQSFSFGLMLQGSEQALFVPIGEETEVNVSSVWDSPKFTGAFLPTERVITPDGFTAVWRVSSFGRAYPQNWDNTNPVDSDTLNASAFGVHLNQGIDLYAKVLRSVKYAILFIVITFAAFFLFEVISALRIHPIQYVLVGAALALFYLLLLSLSEHFGFLRAYLIASVMTALLISAYSSRVLVKRSRAAIIFIMLLASYAYLYFVLHLEDYALLFGSLLLFALLTAVMYLTRNIDWFSASKQITHKE